MPTALTLYLFLFFSSKIPLSYLFFLLLLFLNTCFLFPDFQIPNTVMLVSFSPVHGKGPCTQQPLSSLGVLADHHWSICVPLPIARQKKIILFVCLPWHPFLLWSGYLLSPYPSWHASNGSNSALLLFGGMSS